MADERKIVIVLKAEENSDSEKVPEGAEDPEEPKKASGGKALAAFAVKELVSSTVSETLNWANYEWDKSLNLNDDYIGQRNKNIALQMINKTASTAGTIFSSATYGAMIGGAAGAVVGAVLGTIQSVSSVVRENVQSLEQQDIMLRQMDAQLGYTRQRAGWSLNAASIGEDL